MRVHGLGCRLASRAVPTSPTPYRRGVGIPEPEVHFDASSPHHRRGRWGRPPTSTRPTKTTALTPLQREILVLVMNGLTNREIADRLGMTAGGIGTQVGRIVQKLGLTQRAELVATAAWSC